MTGAIETSPFIGLIDDDGHSANLFMRLLAANDGPHMRHYGDHEDGIAGLAHVLSNPQLAWPDLLVVDLKVHSNANLDFAHRHHGWLHQKGVSLVMMVPVAEQGRRENYREAGAAAVFYRQPELDAYRHELAGIARFWARCERLDAVGM